MGRDASAAEDKRIAGIRHEFKPPDQESVVGKNLSEGDAEGTPRPAERNEDRFFPTIHDVT